MTQFSENTDHQGDARTWVDKMFVDPSPNGFTPLEVVVHDCSKDVNLGRVDVIHNTISLLVDFAADTDSKSVLRGEHVLVLGGNRPTRAGMGRIWVPVTQIGSLISYLQQLQQYLDGNLPSLVEQVRTSR